MATGAGRRSSRAQISFLDLRTDVRERAHGARDLADPQILRPRRFSRARLRPGFFVPDGQLEPERDGLGVHAVGAPDLHGVLELERAPLQRPRAALPARQKNRRRLLAATGACAVSTTSFDVRP